MTISSRMRALLQMEGHEFITALYRELLNREPDPEGLAVHMALLQADVSKMSIMFRILMSAEADGKYNRDY